MATQTVEFVAPTGLTLTTELFSAGSDTLVQAASATTEQTNRKGLYRATFTDAAAGLYKLIARVGSTPVATWWVDLTLATATFQTYEMPMSLITAGSGGGATIVLPTWALSEPRQTQYDLTGYNGELKTHRVYVKDSAGVDINFTLLTLRFRIETKAKVEIITIEDGSITKALGYFEVTVPKAAHATVQLAKWSIRTVTNDENLKDGNYKICYAPLKASV